MTQMESPDLQAHFERVDSVLASDEGFADDFEPLLPAQNVINLHSEAFEEATSRQRSQMRRLSAESENSNVELEHKAKADLPVTLVEEEAQAETAVKTTEEFLEDVPTPPAEDQHAPTKQDTKAMIGAPANDEEPQTTEAISNEHEIVCKSNINALLGIGATAEEADRLLSDANGDVGAAIKQKLFPTPIPTATDTKEEVHLSTEDGQKPLTLLEEALGAVDSSARHKLRKLHLRNGDIAVVLDVKNLGLTCRMRSEDARKASSMFAEGLSVQESEAETEVNGIRYLYVLKRAEDTDFPVLARKSLSILRVDCEGELYTRPKPEDAKEAEPGNGPPKQAIRKTNSTPQPAVTEQKEAKKPINWLLAYETFFRILSHVALKALLVNQDDPAAALPRIEAVSTLAGFYKAASLNSPITTAFTTLFANFDEKFKLWSAIPSDAPRWLLVGANLQNAAVFKEAFAHVVGSYAASGEWKWSVTQDNLPSQIWTSIRRHAEQQTYRRYDVNQELLLLTLTTSRSFRPVSPTSDNLTYSVVMFFNSWIKEHIRYFSRSNPTGGPTKAFCTHADTNCTDFANFYRLLARNPESYLPEKQVFEAVALMGFAEEGNNGKRRAGSALELRPNQKENVRESLKVLKTQAAEAVKDVVESTLRWGGKEQLPYLTNVVVGEEDLPWEGEVKMESGQDDADGEGEDYEDEDMDG